MTTSFKFSDQSVFKADTWLWNFGDGHASTERNPVHSYTGTGRYEVTLNSWCNGVTNVAQKTIVVE